MTVSAINGNYQYTNTYQSQFFSTTISASNLNDLMRQFGVVQTGDEYSDVQALYNTMYSYYTGQIDSQQQANSKSDSTDTNNVAWASVMNEVGLTPKGNLSDDYAAFNAQIQALEESAQTDSDKNEIQAFASQSQSYFVESTNSNQTTATASATDILAALNQAYITAT